MSKRSRRRAAIASLQSTRNASSSEGHFAGPDEARLAALREVMADPAVDAVWFARGGYGSNRIAEAALADLPGAARGKTYMGYSDAGFLLAGFHKAGLDVAWGPMPQDVLRERRRGGGERARSTGWCGAIRRRSSRRSTAPAMAFNLTVLSNLLGTPLEPDFTGVDLLIEEVSEQLYRIDRTMFHVTASANVRRASAEFGSGGSATSLRTTPNSAATKSAIVEEWCARSGIAFGGRADIGHDAAKSRRSVSVADRAEFPSVTALQSSPSCALSEREQQEGLMAQGTGRKAGGGLARPVTPSADLAKITGSSAASAQPGGFEGVGSHPQEQPAKPAKQTGNHGRLDPEADLRRQGSGQHVRDEQASFEPPEVSFERFEARRGSASAGPLSFVRQAATRPLQLSLARGRRAFPGSPGSRDAAGMVMNFSPSRSSTQGVTGSIGMGERVGADRLEAAVLRQPFERAARREDQPRACLLLAFENLGRASAIRRRRIRLRRRCGCQSPGGQRATKNKVSKRRTAWNLGTQRAKGVSEPRRS